MSQATVHSELSSRHLQQIFSALSEGILTLSSDGHIVWANRAALAMHDANTLEALGSSIEHYLKLHALVDAHGTAFTKGQHPLERAASGESFKQLAASLRTRVQHNTDLSLKIDAIPFFNDEHTLESVTLIFHAAAGSASRTATASSQAAFTPTWAGESSSEALSLQRSLEELQAEQRAVRPFPSPPADHGSPPPNDSLTAADTATLRHAQAFRCAPVPMMLFDSDTLYLLEVNQAVMQAFGYHADQLIGHRLFDLPLWRDASSVLSHGLVHLPIRRLALPLQLHSGEQMFYGVSAQRLELQRRGYILVVLQEATPAAHGELDVVQAIESLTRESGWLKRLLHDKLQPPAPPPMPSHHDGHQASLQDLTPREREVLKLVCQGSNDDSIAKTLDLSVNTVRNHLRAIYTKLDIHRRSALIVWALKQMGSSALFD